MQKRFIFLQYLFVYWGSYDDITNKVVRWYYPSGLASSNKLQYETLIRKEKENKIRKNDSEGNFLSYNVFVTHIFSRIFFVHMLSNRVYENHRTRILLVIHIKLGEWQFSFIYYSHGHSAFIFHPQSPKRENFNIFMMVFVTDQIQCTWYKKK